MFRPRVIPVLLLKNKGLVKSFKFKNYRYIGDPINAVKIFNEYKADEIVFLDISASKEKRTVSNNLISNIGDEANMPFSVGGGINNNDQIKNVLNKGAEKVVLTSSIIDDPNFIKESSSYFGSSTIVVNINVKKDIFGKYRVFDFRHKRKLKTDLYRFIKEVEKLGAGELMVTSVDRDGTMTGYDLNLIKNISSIVSIPVIACGGAGSFNHLEEGVNKGYATAVAAGSLFIYHGNRNAVLINYPERHDLSKLKYDL